MTPPPETPVAGETLEEIAERVAMEFRRPLGFNLNNILDLQDAVLSALRNERERAVRIIDEHQAMDVCKDNCWTTIKAAIREGK